MISAPAAICARGKGDGLLGAELGQLRDPLRPVNQIGHELAHPAQVGRLGQRALHPAHDRDLAAGLLAEEPDRFHPVAHAPARFGGHRPQLRQVVRLGQQRDLAQRQIVIGELDRQPVIGRLAVGIGDGLEDVQVKVLGDRQVGRDEDAIVLVVAGQRLADVVAGPLHHDVEVWARGRPVRRPGGM